MGTPAREGTLCPVCLRPAGSGRCVEHGPWEPHQLLTRDDRRRASAHVIRQPFDS